MSEMQRSQGDECSLARPGRRPPEIDRYVDHFLSTVCDTSRRYILELLAAPMPDEQEKMSERRSGDIARCIGLSAATTSEHLKQLSLAGLVSSRREGNMVYYRLSNIQLFQAFQDLLQALDHKYNPLTQDGMPESPSQERYQ